MLGLAIEKEIRENLLNQRFLAASALSILLIVVMVLTLSASYRADVADYRSRQDSQENFIRNFGHLNRVGWMARPLRGPAPYSFLVLGIEREAAQENFLSSPMPVLFSRLDLVTIVTLVMSLMAILFSYNALSGERESGLLKLLLSSNMPRSTLVLGKYIGGTISLLIPFTIGLLAGLLVPAINSTVRLETMDTGIFLLLAAGSFLYISAFYALGLCFSARSESSGVSVLKSLFAWVILVLMIPNIGPFLAAEIYHIPSRTKMDMETWTVTSEERDKIVAERGREMLRTTYARIAPDLARGSGPVRDSLLKAKIDSDMAFKDDYDRYKKDWMAMVNEVNAGQQQKVKAIKEEFAARSKIQERLATMFGMVSPLASYVFLATELTDAGIGADDHWQAERQNYFATMDPLLMGIYNRELKKNPQLSVDDRIDLGDFPRFRHQPLGLSERVEASLAPFGVLVLFNILFLGAAFISFMKYDIR